MMVLTGEFFTTFNTELSLFLPEMFQESINAGELQASLKQDVIILIPKIQ